MRLQAGGSGGQVAAAVSGGAPASQACPAQCAPPSCLGRPIQPIPAPSRPQAAHPRRRGRFPIAGADPRRWRPAICRLLPAASPPASWRGRSEAGAVRGWCERGRPGCRAPLAVSRCDRATEQGGSRRSRPLAALHQPMPRYSHLSAPESAAPCPSRPPCMFTKSTDERN